MVELHLILKSEGYLHETKMSRKLEKLELKLFVLYSICLQFQTLNNID